LPSIFLIFVMPRLMFSLHPSTTIPKGELDRPYSLTLLFVGALLLVVAIWLYKLRVRAAMAEHALEILNDRLDDRRDPTDPGVVRPVPVSIED
jgi:hypothetical protein